MVMGLISWLVVGAIGGWLAGYVLTKSTAFNLTDIVLGLVGAVVGGWIGNMMGLGVEGGISIATVLMAFVGSLIVAWGYKKITGKSAV